MHKYLDEAIYEGLLLAKPYTIEENIRRGKDALRRVLISHRTEIMAMFRDELGWIGFEWGEPGDEPPKFRSHEEFRQWQKSGRRPFDKGGHGLSHIIAKRDWEGRFIQQFKGQKGLDLIDRIIEGIARGNINFRGLKAKITWARMEISLAQKRDGTTDYWLLTSYVKPARGYTYVLESADEWGSGNDLAHTPTHMRPTLARPHMGAACSNKILESTDVCASVTDHTTHLRMNGLHGFVQTWERQTQEKSSLGNQRWPVNIGWLLDL